MLPLSTILTFHNVLELSNPQVLCIVTWTLVADSRATYAETRISPCNRSKKNTRQIHCIDFQRDKIMFLICIAFISPPSLLL